jgi:hypothetical protein
MSSDRMERTEPQAEPVVSAAHPGKYMDKLIWLITGWERGMDR